MSAASANNKNTLFLGDLSTFCSEREIHQAFSPYGEILEIKIMRSEETYRNLSYGFIKFANANSAKKALNGLNGVLFCGRHLRLVHIHIPIPHTLTLLTHAHTHTYTY
ncbi:RNA-binding protein [archaeon]|nr:MAG: RNA-binding protein [archaeon]